MQKIRPINFYPALFTVASFLLFVIVSFSSRAEVFIYIFVGLSILISFVKAKLSVLVNLLYVLVLLFMLGQRSICIGEYIRISPAEAVGLYLFSLLFFILRTRSLYPSGKWLPASGRWFLFFLFSSFLAALYYNRNLNAVLSYLKYPLFFIFAFYVIRRLVVDIYIVRKIILLLVLTGILTSLLGLVESVFVKTASLFGGYLMPDLPGDIFGFKRAMGGFWGGPMLSAYLVLITPFVIALINLFKNRLFIRASMFIAFMCCTIFIILAAYRGIWISYIFGLIMYGFYKGKKGILFVLLLCIAIYIFAAPIIVARIEQLDPQRAAIASSAIGRYERIKDSIDIIKAHPVLGIGLGGSGLVHSDILQFASDGGILMAVFFILFYLNVLNGLRGAIRNTADPELKEYKIAFLSSLFGFFFSFFTEGYTNLPAVYVPFWFIMGMGYLLANFENGKRYAEAK